MSGKVAVVTGSNKGIGFAIVRALCQKFKGDVILTARDAGRGEESVSELKAEGLNPKFHQLDLLDKPSIAKLKDFIVKNYGGLDLLVNNAGIAFKGAATEPFAEQARVTVRCNYWGTLDVCDVLFPILRPHARVVHVSSMSGKMAIDKCSKTIQTQFTSPTLTIPELGKLMTHFVESAEQGNHKANGFAESAYGVSKIGVTAMASVQQRDIDKVMEDVIINACCPGHVNTDMSSRSGTKTPDQGADTPVYLALLPPGIKSPRGEFLSNRKIVQMGG